MSLSRDGALRNRRGWLRTVRAARVQRTVPVRFGPTPDDHFPTGPHRYVTVPGLGRVRRRHQRPTVCDGIISFTIVEIVVVLAPPNDHFVAGPHRAVRVSRRGPGADVSGYPTIRLWIVSAAGVRIIERFIHAAPHNHFAPGPNCRVSVAPSWRIRRTRTYPNVCAWIIPPSGVKPVAR